MKLYAFLDKKPVIFDTEDIAEMFAYDGLFLITLKDGYDYDCAYHISMFPELLPDYDLENATEIKMKGRDVFTGNSEMFDVLKRLRKE
jgi:hypothetical protein